MTKHHSVSSRKAETTYQQFPLWHRPSVEIVFYNKPEQAGNLCKATGLAKVLDPTNEMQFMRDLAFSYLLNAIFLCASSIYIQFFIIFAPK